MTSADETFESGEELLAYQRQTAEMAIENERLASSNFANVGLPWRYFKWRRIHKEVMANLDELNRRYEVGERARASLFR